MAGPNRLLWLSLVCALFAPDTDHEIQSVRINMGLLDGLSKDTIRAALRHVNRDETHSIRHLHLMHVYYNYSSKGVVYDLVAPAAAMVKCVGSSLEQLTFEKLMVQRDESDQFFDTIFTNCPKLKRLDLERCDIESLESLCHEKSRLESVFLKEMQLEESGSLTVLLSALGDPTHTLPQSLRELHIDFKPSWDGDRIWTQEAQDSCLAMLETNRSLTRFELAKRESIVSAPWTPRFLAHHGSILPGRQGPLAPAVTLAFLSVVSRSHPTPASKTKTKRTKPIAKHKSTRYRLDVDAMRLILEMAALPLRRTCILV